MSVEAWPAPAKLNLFLHVIGRRADGYHVLQTVFQFLDWCDYLRFEPRRDGRIQRVSALPGVNSEQDLTVRAARMLQQETGINHGLDIHLEKRLPLGGGLGGGSSDAATTLVALNVLWGLGLSLEKLAVLGARLGADVPIFIFGHAAWGEGIGDQLIEMQLPEPWYVVVIPPCQVSTAEIFSAPELTRDVPPIKIGDFLAGEGGNSCEPVVRRRYPLVDQALTWLGQFAPARMSGTGAAVFAAFAGGAQARQVAAQAPLGWQAVVARGCNRSPLHVKLRQKHETSAKRPAG